MTGLSRSAAALERCEAVSAEPSVWLMSRLVGRTSSEAADLGGPTGAGEGEREREGVGVGLALRAASTACGGAAEGEGALPEGEPRVLRCRVGAAPVLLPGSAGEEGDEGVPAATPDPLPLSVPEWPLAEPRVAGAAAELSVSEAAAGLLLVREAAARSADPFAAGGPEPAEAAG